MSPEKPTDIDPANPQAKEMADESMVRTLAAQANAIWPQEAPLFARYGLPQNAEILDAGCGTGEITLRLAELYPNMRVLGVDVLPAPRVARAPQPADSERRRRDWDHQAGAIDSSVFDLGLPWAPSISPSAGTCYAIPHPNACSRARARRSPRRVAACAGRGLRHAALRAADLGTDPFRHRHHRFGEGPGPIFILQRAGVLSGLGLKN